MAPDVVTATVCLTLHLALITQTRDLKSHTAPITQPFDWRSYHDTLSGGDWRRGTMLRLTTLAHTALHLAVGLGAMLSHSAQVDCQIATILTPARDALHAAHSRVKEKCGGARARLVLTSDALHQQEDLLARKEVSAGIATVIQIGLFMTALIWGVLTLAQRLALPQLCPAP